MKTTQEIAAGLNAFANQNSEIVARVDLTASPADLANVFAENGMKLFVGALYSTAATIMESAPDVVKGSADLLRYLRTLDTTLKDANLLEYKQYVVDLATTVAEFLDPQE